MDEHTPPGDHLVAPQEAARRLGISRNTLLRWEESGHITPIRLPSGVRRYRTADIDALISAKASA